MSNYPNFSLLSKLKPKASAKIYGNKQNPSIIGNAYFYQLNFGVIVVVDVEGLPKNDECDSPIFAMHIHAGDSCSGNENDEFADSGTHYNPKNYPHPYHAGDLPPLFSANGYAFSMFLTSRFTIDEVVGKTIIIHSSVDDFKTQPSGNSNEKIACGEIKELND